MCTCNSLVTKAKVDVISVFLVSCILGWLIHLVMLRKIDCQFILFDVLRMCVGLFCLSIFFGLGSREGNFCTMMLFFGNISIFL